MYLADYHMHSKYSFDGSEELDTICQTAIRRGLSEIAITDHMDIYTGLPYDEQMNFEVPGGEQYHMDVSGSVWRTCSDEGKVCRTIEGAHRCGAWTASGESGSGGAFYQGLR
ncbi:MAG: PHP domain-containing protein [Coprococcus catus]